MPADVVFVENLRVFAPIGVTAAEQTLGTWLTISVEAEIDGGFGMVDVPSLDYGLVATTAHGLATAGPRVSLETLAVDIADAVLRLGEVRAVDVIVSKDRAAHPVPVGAYGVRVRRERPPAS